MNIGQALERLQAGGLMRRMGWNGKGMYIGLQRGLGAELPYVYLVTANNLRVPWTCGQTDLLADDWVISDGR